MSDTFYHQLSRVLEKAVIANGRNVSAAHMFQSAVMYVVSSGVAVAGFFLVRSLDFATEDWLLLCGALNVYGITWINPGGWWSNGEYEATWIPAIEAAPAALKLTNTG